MDSAMPKLVVLNPGRGEQAHMLNATRITIGRAEGNSIQIVHATVSGRHCEAMLRGNELFVHDLDSTNGTFINGLKIHEGVLRLGQVLRLGDVDLRLQVSVPPLAPEIAALLSGSAASLTSVLPPAPEPVQHREL